MFSYAYIFDHLLDSIHNSLIYTIDVVAINNKIRLQAEDYECLSDGKWFSNTLLEYILQVLVLRSKNVEGSCINSSNVFLEHPNAVRFVQFKKRFVLFPLIDAHYFVLFILDLHQKLIAFLDPMGEKQQDFTKYVKNVGDFLDQYNSKFSSIACIDEWRVKKYDHNIQNDSVNCGPYVVRFCELFISKGEITLEEFNPNKYRTELQKMILRTSNPDMNDACLICGRNERQTEIGSDWIQCFVCDRWLHCSAPCANVITEDYQNDDELYRCRLCRLHFAVEPVEQNNVTKASIMARLKESVSNIFAQKTTISLL